MVWWGICIWLCYKFPTESNSERILKIGQYLLKLWARIKCLVFLTDSVNLFKTQSLRSEKARRAQLQSAQRCVYARTIRGFFSRIAGKEEKNILSLCVSVAGSPGPRAYWIRRTLRETRSIAPHLFLSGLHSGTVVARRDGRNIDENTAIKPR